MAQYINSNGEYYNGGSIVIGDTRYLSPSDEILELAGYHKVEPTQEELLEQAKANKLLDIEMYDQSSAVNVFYLTGQPLWLDAHTRQQLRISIEAYKAQGVEYVNKWFNGQQYTFPTDLWLSMLNTLEVYAGESLNVTETHKANVMALQSTEAVESYDYTTGYPNVLQLDMNV